jgi:DNA-binding NarL/FixJ family response regulator
MRIDLEIVATVGSQRIPLKCEPLIVEVDTTAVTLSIDRCIVPLTRREVQVRDLLLLGKAHKEIANELKISARTSKYHAGTLYAKYNVEDRQMLVAKLQPPTAARISKGKINQ